ncbi:acyl-CoA N-acyltransferase [Lophiostoma macrostomum CBS 122681]|uniref:Acyl-CoA N-acyltransferase n=1 Tax=Lophiostoma macrostomum CBS 122681 TaxID=1314788 RepID=A0A6A6TM34_9PLEO|nr:acyl-CoA N-acyltransferase [Lophiostoma macrostomum CBS 122681]
MPLPLTLTLHEASKTDIDELVHVYFSAFQSPLSRLVMPDVPGVRAWWRESLLRDWERGFWRVWKVVEWEEGGQEKIVAFAKWSVPHGEGQGKEGKEGEKEVKKEGKDRWPVEGNPEVFEQVFEKVVRHKREALGDGGEDRVFYLSIMGTLPTHQRRGAGSLLMTEFCRQADASPRKERCYLEASPKGKSTYERYGFETKSRFSTVVNGEEYVNCCMVREAR